MKVAWLGIAALLVAGILVALRHPALPDVSWPLYLAREIIHGARLTVDFQEINPPLFVWISLPAAFLGETTGVPLWPIAVILVGATIAGSLMLCASFLERSPFAHLQPFLLPCLAFAFAILPLGEFANREHLALVLTTPYVILTAVRITGYGPSRPTAVLAGVLGALGFALKPYFLVAWVLVELVATEGLGLRALRRVESVVLILVGAGYGVAILILEPGYLRLAMTWGGLYGRYLSKDLWLGMFPDWWSILPVFAAGTVVSMSLRGRVTPLHRALIAAALGFWVGAAVQHKAFNYHHLAGAGYGFTVIALSAREAGRIGWRRPSDLVLQVARTGVALGVLINLAVFLRYGARRREFLPDQQYPRILAAVRTESRGESLLVLSSNPAIGWPLTLDAGVTWASRFMCQWQLGALYDHELWQVGGLVRFRPFAERSGVERTFDDAMLEDLVERRPRLIVVLGIDASVWGFGGATRLDYLQYFRADPRFDAALRNYEELTPVGRYRLFRRR